MLRKLLKEKPDGYIPVEERLKVIEALMTMDRRVNELFIWRLAYEYNKRPGADYLMPDMIAEIMKVIYPDTRQRGIKNRLEYWLENRLGGDPTLSPGRLFNEMVWYFRLDRQINRAKIKDLIKTAKTRFIMRDQRNRNREAGLEDHLTEACEEVLLGNQPEEAEEVIDEDNRAELREIIEKLSKSQKWTKESYERRKARLNKCMKKACAELGLKPPCTVTEEGREVPPEPIDEELTNGIRALIEKLSGKSSTADSQGTTRKKRRVTRFPKWSIVPEVVKPPEISDPRRTWLNRILSQSHQVIVAFVIMFCRQWCKKDDKFGKQLVERVVSVAFPGDGRHPTALQCWVKDMLRADPRLRLEELVDRMTIKFCLDRFKMRGYLSWLVEREKTAGYQKSYKTKIKAKRRQNLTPRRTLSATR